VSDGKSFAQNVVDTCTIRNHSERLRVPIFGLAISGLA
jgi:hypothetical protein